MAQPFAEFPLTGSELTIAVFTRAGFYVQPSTDTTTFLFFGTQQIEVDGAYADVRDQIAST